MTTRLGPAGALMDLLSTVVVVVEESEDDFMFIDNGAGGQKTQWET